MFIVPRNSIDFSQQLKVNKEISLYEITPDLASFVFSININIYSAKYKILGYTNRVFKTYTDL